MTCWGKISLDVIGIEDISKITINLRDNNSSPIVEVYNNGTLVLGTSELLIDDQGSEYLKLDVSEVDFDELLIGGRETILYSVELE